MGRVGEEGEITGGGTETLTGGGGLAGTGSAMRCPARGWGGAEEGKTEVQGRAPFTEEVEGLGDGLEGDGVAGVD